MQKHYQMLSKDLNEDTHIKKKLYHPQWQKFGNEIKRLIQGSPNIHFLKNSTLSGTMVRSGMNIGQTYEICYLNQCISKKTQNILRCFQEPNGLGFSKECKEWQCSANTLGQLFYAGRILESTDSDEVSSIIELGAGFGSLAHIFKSTLPKINYYIIDLPELLAIQFLYLKLAMPHENIHLHTASNHFDMQEKGIHLIPVHIAHELDLDTDIFISNFALSEATHYVQELIAEKRFFNADLAYITGQLDGWGGAFGFEKENTVFNAVRSQFNQVFCQPFHLILTSLKSYEIIAKKI